MRVSRTSRSDSNDMRQRDELQCLRAKYDIYSVIKQLERDISWSEYRLREKTLRAIQDAYSVKR